MAGVRLPGSIHHTGAHMTYVLIPGAGGDGSYWQLVAAELRVRGHDALAIDLPADDDDADIPDYADVVVDAIGDTARRHPGRPVDGWSQRSADLWSR